MRVSDGVEACEWSAIVGFVDLPLRWAILGHAGFLDYFDTEFLGAHREVVIYPNSSFHGQHSILPKAPA
jgi:hypothetical protein